jgi:hypothetical protein
LKTMQRAVSHSEIVPSGRAFLALFCSTVSTWIAEENMFDLD